MKNIHKPVVTVIFFLILTAAPLLAQESTLDDNRASMFKLSLIVGGGIIAFVAAAGAFCQAKAISSACQGISRNPGAGPHIRFIVLLGLILIETLVIYTLIMSIVILLVQWGKYS